MDDINKFEHAGQTTEGCQSGQHVWDEAEGHSTVEADGDLTKIKLRCLMCQKQFDISAPLGLNEFIGKQQNITTPPINYGGGASGAGGMNANVESDILKRILG